VGSTVNCASGLSLS